MTMKPVTLGETPMECTSGGKVLVDCPKCAGTGSTMVAGTEHKCRRCLGSGKTWENPPGYTTGEGFK